MFFPRSPPLSPLLTTLRLSHEPQVVRAAWGVAGCVAGFCYAGRDWRRISDSEICCVCLGAGFLRLLVGCGRSALPCCLLWGGVPSPLPALCNLSCCFPLLVVGLSVRCSNMPGCLCSILHICCFTPRFHPLLAEMCVHTCVYKRIFSITWLGPFV